MIQVPKKVQIPKFHFGPALNFEKIDFEKLVEHLKDNWGIGYCHDWDLANMIADFLNYQGNNWGVMPVIGILINLGAIETVRTHMLYEYWLVA